MPDKRPNPEPLVLAIAGAGRAGGALARAARRAGIDVRAAGREELTESCAGAGAVLLCVPDSRIAAVCEELVGGGDVPDFLGHVSGATGLTALAAAADRGARTFSRSYLKSVRDPYDKASPYHRWKEKLSQGAMESRLGVAGNLREIDILKRGKSPRIVRARIVGSGGGETVSGATLQARLGLLSSWASFRKR
jgi:hypothetical protein